MSNRRDLALRLLRYSAVRGSLERVAPWFSRAGFFLEHALARDDERRRAESFGAAHTADPVDGLVLVEFMGPSGVGKSTLENALLASDEVSVVLAPVGGLIDWTSLDLPRLTSEDVSPPVDRMYLELLRRKTKTVLDEAGSADYAASLMKFLAKNLREDLRLVASRASGNVLRSEGLLHNFGKDMLDMERQGAGELRRIVGERVIVSCTAPPDLVVDRALSREIAGGHRAHYFGRSRREIADRVASALERTASTIEAFREAGVEVVAVDVSNPDLAGIAMALRDAIARCRKKSDSPSRQHR